MSNLDKFIAFLKHLDAILEQRSAGGKTDNDSGASTGRA